ncbi:MAG: winged helix-turn-helix domain-containing protein, partial [Prevotella sp.]|nr:winged helix-turn-helix domain-containing protein [Prevotella sp.]
GCLLDAMLNYKPEGDDDSEGVQDKIQDKIQDKVHDKLHDKFPELSEKTIDVLDAIKKYPGHNANEIGEQIGLSERQVKTYITKLKQLGLIVRVGSNKTGYWRVSI